MRYPASEKAEIIQLVEQSHLPAKRTLDKLGIPRATFYRWYDRYREGGPEALDDRRSRPDRVWNRMNVFQIHGVDSAGKVVITRQLQRKQVLEFFSKLPGCLVGMEACGTGHHWAREISKLGHTVRLMPPSYLKGYEKRSKSDVADAAAICEAVTRPSMRFVPIKSADQQALLMLHRTRDLLVRQRTQLINALRAHLAEFGLVAATGREGLAQLAAIITDESIANFFHLQ